jgi:hypothetical protein
MSEERKFNALGADHRQCPLCYRQGALDGPLTVGRTLVCKGCWRSFRFDGGGDVDHAHTLTRLTTSFPSHNRCRCCGNVIGAAMVDCQPCIAAAEAQARLAAGGAR